MIGYYIEGNVVTITTSISIEAFKMLKSFGYIIKYIC